MLQTIAFALATTFAGAAPAESAARPDPADAKAAVPAPRYESVFKEYRGYAEPELVRWRDVNEEMARLGGHVGHLPQSARQSKPAAKPGAQTGHGGHK